MTKKASKTVTLREIADACGVAHSTVSRALRNRPEIPEVTRRKVLEKAQALGYCPDARLNELMARVRAGRKSGYQGNIAVVYVKSLPGERGQFRQIGHYVAGIRQRAEALGYGVDEFWLEGPGVEPGSLVRMLRSRGINGALLVHPLAVKPLPDLDWGALAWVTVGFISDKPQLHAVTPDWTADAAQVTRHLLAQGCRCVGFIYSDDSDPLTGNAWLSGYAATVLMQGMQPLVFRGTEHTMRGIVDWCREHQPDGIVTHSSYPEELLGRAGISVKFGRTNLAPETVGYAGIVSSCFETGLSAVDALVGQFIRGERGPTVFQKKIRTKGRWAEGA